MYRSAYCTKLKFYTRHDPYRIYRSIQFILYSLRIVLCSYHFKNGCNIFLFLRSLPQIAIFGAFEAIWMAWTVNWPLYACKQLIMRQWGDHSCPLLMLTKQQTCQTPSTIFDMGRYPTVSTDKRAQIVELSDAGFTESRIAQQLTVARRQLTATSDIP